MKDRAIHLTCAAVTAGFGFMFDSGVLIAMGIVFAVAAAAGEKYDG